MKLEETKEKLDNIAGVLTRSGTETTSNMATTKFFITKVNFMTFNGLKLCLPRINTKLVNL